MSNYCRVYWGSHGCQFERGHEGDCICECSGDPEDDLDPNFVDVGKPPYYGPVTQFFGEDVAVRGLSPLANS